MKINFLRVFIGACLFILFVNSCEKLLIDDPIDLASKYDVTYIYKENSEYEKMYNTYSNLTCLDENVIINEIKRLKSNKNIKGGIIKDDLGYIITIKEHMLVSKIYFIENDKQVYYDDYKVVIDNNRFSVEKYGFTLQSKDEHFYTFEINSFLIAEMLDKNYDFVYVKIPLIIKGKFDLTNNYLECEIDI